MFDEVNLPEAIAYGGTGGPGFSTRVVTAASGHERREAQQDRGRLRWDLSSSLRTREQLSALITFWRARHGPLRGFRFRDWSDFQANSEPLGPVVAGALQLIKTYASGPSSEVRTITKPVAGTVTLTRDGAPYADFTVDATTGRVTLLGAETGVFAWSGEFDVPVRFELDEMKVGLSNKNSGTWTNLAVVEIL